MLTAIRSGASKIESAGYDTTATTGTIITGNNPGTSDGAWTQLIASTANDWYAFHVIMHVGSSSIAGRGLVDIAIGAAASEKVIVASLPTGHLAGAVRSVAYRVWLPLFIPKGSRVSARVHRSDANTFATRIALWGVTHATRYAPPFARATTYGEDLTNKRGTVVDPGASSNTLGSNTQIVASTTNPISALYLLAMKQDVAVLSASLVTAMEIYVGGSGSEVVLIPEMPLYEINATADITMAFGCGIGPLFVNVPAGSRLSAKARCSDNTSGAREAQLLLLGLD